jgi:hypothetical protein
MGHSVAGRGVSGQRNAPHGLPNRLLGASRSCASPLLLRFLFDVGDQGSVSPHQVEAEVGPVIKSALSSGHTTSNRSNTVRISSSISKP